MSAIANTRAYEANVRRFYAFSFLFMLQLFIPIWVIYLIDVRGLTLGQVTAMEGPFWLATLLMEVPTGVIADRYGRTVSLRAGAIVNAAGMFAFAFSDNFGILFGSYMLLALAITLFSGADAALFYDSLKAAGREHDYQKLWGRCWALQSGGLAVRGDIDPLCRDRRGVSDASADCCVLHAARTAATRGRRREARLCSRDEVRGASRVA
jgi:MFS family permease